MGIENTGRLAVGMKADLAVIDLDQRETVPAPYALSTLVYSGNPGMVTDTMVNGRWVYRNRAFPNLDEAGVRARARAAVERILANISQ